jgi:hypothetical protein
MSTNVKNHSCWDCHYFHPINSEVEISGYCRRYAPHSLDFFGLDAAGGGGGGQIFLMWFQASRFQDQQATEVLLSRDGETPGSGQTKAISNPNTSYNNGGCFPFTTPNNTSIYAVQLTASSFAVWGLTESEAPFLKVDFYLIDGTSETLIGSADIPTDVNLTHDRNSWGDAFQNTVYVLPIPISIPASGLFGWRIDATNNNDDKVYRTKNVIVSPYIGVEYIPPENALLEVNALPEVQGTSESKWSLISDGPEMWCGEFKPSSKVVPPIPEPVQILEEE